MAEQLPSTNFSASWTRVDETSDPSFYPAVLDATRAQLLDDARREPGRVFGPLELRPGLRVLDVGCGTGDYLRVLAPFAAPGSVTGIDLSASLIGLAQRRNTPTDAKVTFCVANANSLPFPDASFDRVVATQVLLHLAEPMQAISEMHRVLAPGGLLSIGEWDWDSTCLAVSERNLGRRLTHLLCDQMNNGLIVRDLAWQLDQAGFTGVDVTPQVKVSRDIDAAYTWLIEPVVREFARTGAFTADESSRFLNDLQERAAAGRYFLARTYYSIIARRVRE